MSSSTFDDMFGRPVADHADLPDIDFNRPDNDD